MATSAPRKPSSIRHTRAIQRDRPHRVPPAPPTEQVATHLTDLSGPATFAQVAALQTAGVRCRVLTLPVMIAFVRNLIGHQIGSVREAMPVLNQAGLLWPRPTPLSPQAMNRRVRLLTWLGVAGSFCRTP